MLEALVGFLGVSFGILGFTLLVKLIVDITFW